jgi:hypothetical protein
LLAAFFASSVGTICLRIAWSRTRIPVSAFYIEIPAAFVRNEGLHLHQRQHSHWHCCLLLGLDDVSFLTWKSQTLTGKKVSLALPPVLETGRCVFFAWTSQHPQDRESFVHGSGRVWPLLLTLLFVNVRLYCGGRAE